MISFACAQCGASVQAQDQLLGQFTICPSCQGSVPVPLPDVTAEPESLPSEALMAEPVLVAEPSRAEMSPFAYIDQIEGPAVINRSVTERAYRYYGRDALGLGILAIVLMIFPCINLISGVVALIGLATSIKGIVKCQSRSTSGLAMSIVGLVLSALVCLFWGLALLGALAGAVLR